MNKYEELSRKSNILTKNLVENKNIVEVDIVGSPPPHLFDETPRKQVFRKATEDTLNPTSDKAGVSFSSPKPTPGNKFELLHETSSSSDDIKSPRFPPNFPEDNKSEQ